MMKTIMMTAAAAISWRLKHRPNTTTTTLISRFTGEDRKVYLMKLAAECLRNYAYCVNPIFYDGREQDGH
jgi:hypothetical protein